MVFTLTCTKNDYVVEVLGESYRTMKTATDAVCKHLRNFKIDGLKWKDLKQTARDTLEDSMTVEFENDKDSIKYEVTENDAPVQSKKTKAKGKAPKKAKQPKAKGKSPKKQPKGKSPKKKSAKIKPKGRVNWDSDLYAEEFKHLREKGYVVIPNILNEDKCAQYIEEMWDWLEGLGTGIDRDDDSTWGTKQWPPNTRGIMQHLRAGHAQFMWTLRQDPAVMTVFCELWGVEADELIVSSDGFCIMKPEAGKKEKWLHFDQGPRKIGLHCVQGSVAFDDGDSFMVVPGSHRLHQKFYNEFGIDQAEDWHKLTNDQLQFLTDRDLEPVNVEVKAGDVVLWDSRTIHCNSPTTDADTWRHAAYVCYLPRSHADEKKLEKKRKYFLEQRQTSHWPDNPKVVSLKWNTWGEDPVDYQVHEGMPVLTHIGWRLAGFEQDPNDEGDSGAEVSAEESDDGLVFVDEVEEESSGICSSCDQPLRVGAKFCAKCGSEVAPEGYYYEEFYVTEYYDEVLNGDGEWVEETAEE